MRLRDRYTPVARKLKATRSALLNVTCAAVNRTALITHYDNQREKLRSSESLTESNHSQCNLDMKNMGHVRQKALAIVFYASDLVAQAQDYIIGIGNVTSCFSWWYQSEW